MAFQTKGKHGSADRKLRCGELDLAVETTRIAVFRVRSKQLQAKEFALAIQISS
jgi:Holliday junction resolvase-like predicted endonuclease